MKINFFRKVLSLLLGILLVVSCEKNDSVVGIQGDYLLDYELISSYSKEEVTGRLALAALAYPELAVLVPSAKYGVNIYRLSYKVIFQGNELTASGLICLPEAAESFPFISFQNGTNTCHSNAPSVNPTNEFYSLISIMAGSGYIITIPDYIGFGESEGVLHPYHHITSSNEAIINLLKAGQEMVSSEQFSARSSEDMYLMGYSQGGWATLAAANSLESNTTIGLNIKAIACGAGAYNLMALSKHVLALDEYVSPFYLPYFIESRRRNDILSESLMLYFNVPYPETITGLFDGSYCNGDLNTEFSTKMGELMTTDIINNFETEEHFATLRSELVLNSVGAWNIQAKTRLYHSHGDKSVPSFLSEEIYDDFMDEGVSPNNITLILVDSLDHNDAIIPWGVDALNWIINQ